jgi:hypothetical protein
MYNQEYNIQEFVYSLKYNYNFSGTAYFHPFVTMGWQFEDFAIGYNTYIYYIDWSQITGQSESNWVWGSDQDWVWYYPSSFGTLEEIWGKNVAKEFEEAKAEQQVNEE